MRADEIRALLAGLEIPVEALSVLGIRRHLTGGVWVIAGTAPSPRVDSRLCLLLRGSLRSHLGHTSRLTRGTALVYEWYPMRTLRRSRSRKASSSRSLAEDVYRAIRGAILANRFEAGLLLSERELARRLAVSKTPVREALIRLAHEGFVEVSPRRGMLLPKASVQDLKELFAVRSALEGLAAETAVGLIPAETLARLRQGLVEAARDKDQERLFQLGAELHELAIQASGNQRLASIVGTMRAQVARYSRLASTLPEQSERSLREHLEVIDALEGGDGAGARRAIEAHIRGVRDNLIRALL